MTALWGKVKSHFRTPRVGLAFSGGGCKAFFAVGVGQALREASFPIYALAGTSAGSAMGLCVVSDLVEPMVEYFCSITRRNKSNWYWSRLLRGRRPFPHERMYISAIVSYVDPDRIRASGVKLAFNAMRLPPDLYPSTNRLTRYRLLTDVIAALRKEARFAERGMYHNFLRELAEERGLEEIVFTEKDLRNHEMILKIILASSSVPPMLSFQKLPDGNYYLDGGIYNNLPIAHLPDDCDFNIAVYYEEITRHLFEKTGQDRGRNIFYITPPPGKEVPISTFDYANPDGVRAAYEMGLEAGRTALPALWREFKNL